MAQPIENTVTDNIPDTEQFILFFKIPNEWAANASLW